MREIKNDCNIYSEIANIFADGFVCLWTHQFNTEPVQTSYSMFIFFYEISSISFKVPVCRICGHA